MQVDINSLLSNLLQIAAVIGLVMLNGFFVAAEFSLVSVRRTRIEELVTQGKKGATAVRKALENPDKVIAATQLGITISSLALGWIGEPALSRFIEPLIHYIPIPSQLENLTSHGISAAIGFTVITFLHVVVGELAPKSVALQRPESTSIFVAQPMLGIEAMFTPAIWALNGAGNLILRLFGLETVSGHDLVHSVEEIKMLVAASADHGVVAAAEYDMVDAVFDLRQMVVRQLMIPRTEMATLSADSTLKELVDLLKEDPHEKYPIYDKDIDHITGMLYIRDVVQELAQQHLQKQVKAFNRPAIFLPDSARISNAITAMRSGRQHAAIVLDEYGGTAGLLTLEDIMEEIAGDIPDQFDANEKPEIIRRKDGSWELSGLALIEDVNEELHTKMVDENYDTIGGFVMGKLERVPQKGDAVQIGEYLFRVTAIDGMRIDRLIVSSSRNSKS